jgi:hypothetical protein
VQHSADRCLVALAAVILATIARLTFGFARDSLGMTVTAWDDAVVRWLTGLRVPGMTGLMQAIVVSTGPAGMISVLRWATLIALLVLRRFHHLMVFVGSFLAVLLVVRLVSVDRPRPFGVELQGSWAGWAMPSRPVAILSATLVGCSTRSYRSAAGGSSANGWPPAWSRRSHWPGSISAWTRPPTRSWGP